MFVSAVLNDEPPANDRRLSGVLAGLFAVIALLAGVDLASDAAEGITLRHAVVEGLLAAVSLGGLVAMARRFRRLRTREQELVDETRVLAHRLEQTQGEAQRWKREAGELVAGLSVSIDEQLTRWTLTPAEKEVALLLLKGLSMKEIALVRGVTQATARQQAAAIYRKGGLAGRSELSAFFLEDLLAPRAG